MVVVLGVWVVCGCVCVWGGGGGVRVKGGSRSLNFDCSFRNFRFVAECNFRHLQL